MKSEIPLPPPILIDFEASGLQQPDSYPIEVAVLKPDGSSYSSLIKPHSSWDHWSFESQEIHNIPRQVLHDCGKDVKTVAVELKEFINNETVYCDSVHWDSFWCRRLFNTANEYQDFNFASLHNYISTRQHMYWYNAKALAVEEFREKNLPEHRALNDVQIIQRAFFLSHTIK